MQVKRATHRLLLPRRLRDYRRGLFRTLCGVADVACSFIEDGDAATGQRIARSIPEYRRLLRLDRRQVRRIRREGGAYL